MTLIWHSIQIEELAEKGASVSNDDLSQKLSWSGPQSLAPPRRRASRSLSPMSGPAASSTRRSNIGAETGIDLDRLGIVKIDKTTRSIRCIAFVT